jgi:cytochrome P450
MTIDCNEEITMNNCPYQNLLDPDLFLDGDHHTAMADIRNQGGPVVKIDDPITGVPYWAIQGREEADFICKNPELFSSEIGGAAAMEFNEEELEKQRLMIVNMDPPKHNKYRRIARNAFTPATVDSYAGKFSQYAQEIVDRVALKGECEFVEEVAAELPLTAILEICGIPQRDRKQFFKWTNAMFFTKDDDMSEGDDNKAAAQEAGINVFMYGLDMAAEHARNPKDNLVGKLLDGKVDGEKLTPDEFCAFFMLLLVGGIESTRSVTAHAMRLLIEHPEQLQLLQEDPSLIPYACEEALRYNAAFLAMKRVATRDVALAGQQIKAGDKVVLFWHGINRDDRVFGEDAMQFDVTRYRNMPSLYKEHRAFGIGQHFCLGAHLARLQLRLIFEQVVPRMRNPRFAEPVRYVRDYFVNGIKEMRITFDPES